MDRKELFKKLEISFGAGVKEPEFVVLSDHKIDGVEFLVISPSFKEMSRDQRMTFVARHLEKVLGAEFYHGVYVGSALTRAECKKVLPDLKIAF